jgi:hypothetical protein
VSVVSAGEARQRQVRGRHVVVEVQPQDTEPCWHCNGDGVCDCIVCDSDGVPDEMWNVAKSVLGVWVLASTSNTRSSKKKVPEILELFLRVAYM